MGPVGEHNANLRAMLECSTDGPCCGSIQSGKLTPSMFPDDLSASMPLERCVRILPHQNDSGGFFVAVLQKVGPLADKKDW